MTSMAITSARPPKPCRRGSRLSASKLTCATDLALMEPKNAKRRASHDLWADLHRSGVDRGRHLRLRDRAAAAYREWRSLGGRAVGQRGSCVRHRERHQRSNTETLHGGGGRQRLAPRLEVRRGLADGGRRCRSLACIVPAAHWGEAAGEIAPTRIVPGL